MKKALLVIGENKISRNRPYVSFKKFIKHAKKLNRRFELKIISYEQLLSGNPPQITAPFVKIALFFPYKYWNRNIEVYPDNRIYGDKIFGRTFKALFRKVESAIDRHYRGKRIQYLNPPQACYIDRDKSLSKNLLRRRGIPVPASFKVSSLAGVETLLNKGKNLYIKPRFGAMGKGLTYIDRNRIVSNFLYRRGKIISRLSDFNWPFRKIKAGRNFIHKLLERGFICEEAIQPPVFKRRRFDFRIYVIFGRVVYLYAKSSPAQFWVTNWSQGGRIDKRKVILRTIPKETIARIKALARKAARALNLNFAGIDIVVSPDFKSAYVLEGNAFPGHEKGFDLMHCLAASLLT